MKWETVNRKRQRYLEDQITKGWEDTFLWFPQQIDDHWYWLTTVQRLPDWYFAEMGRLWWTYRVKPEGE